MKDDVAHLDDELELYALGMLPDVARQRIEAHVALCDPCAQRLGQAEMTVATMVDATLSQVVPLAAVVASPSVAASSTVATGQAVQLRPRPRWQRSWAVAAVVALSFTGFALAQQNIGLRSDIGADDSAFHALLRSHFSHAQFSALDGKPIAAKVLYDRHGGWYEILATGIDPASRIAIVRGSTVTAVGRGFTVSGDVYLLALPAAADITEFLLLDARGRTIARVQPVLTAAAK